MTEKAAGDTQVSAEQMMNAGTSDDWEPPVPEGFVEDRGDDLEPVAEKAPEPVKEVEKAPEKPVEAVKEVENPAEKPAEEAKVEDHTENRIPKSRFDEVNERRKAAEQRNVQLEAELAKSKLAPDVDIDLDAKESEYMEAMLDGDKEKALAVRKEIRAAEQAMYGKKALEAAETLAPQVQAQVNVAALVKELNAEYPLFDKESPDYNEDALIEAVTLSRGYQAANRYDAETALRTAVEKTAKIYDFVGVSKRKAAAVEEVPKPTTKDVKAKLALAEKQPIETPASSAATDGEFDINEMPDAEFDRLPEATKRRLRGDYN